MYMSTAQGHHSLLFAASVLMPSFIVWQLAWSMRNFLATPAKIYFLACLKSMVLEMRCLRLIYDCDYAGIGHCGEKDVINCVHLEWGVWTLDLVVIYVVSAITEAQRTGIQTCHICNVTLVEGSTFVRSGVTGNVILLLLAIYGEMHKSCISCILSVMACGPDLLL